MKKKTTLDHMDAATAAAVVVSYRRGGCCCWGYCRFYVLMVANTTYGRNERIGCLLASFLLSFYVLFVCLPSPDHCLFVCGCVAFGLLCRFERSLSGSVSSIGLSILWFTVKGLLLD
jgi:hypothetical protein